MQHRRTYSGQKRRISRPGDLVKGRIVAAGLQLKQVAQRAGIARSTLSDYLADRIRSAGGQLKIYHAYCDLSGERPTLREFWGVLSHEEIR